MKRRTFLTGATTTALPLVGGCVARTPGTGTADTPTGNQSGIRTESGTDTADDEDTPSAGNSPSLTDSKGPVRAESDADVEVTEVEDDEDTEYVPEEDAVRYVSAWRNTNLTEMKEGEPPEREPVYDTVPFERWGKTNCVTAAAGAAADYAAAELGAEGFGGGISFAFEERDFTAVVSTSTVLDREGDVVSEPSVAFDALVAATPATVDATYRIDDREYELSAPIYVRHDVMHQT